MLNLRIVLLIAGLCLLPMALNADNNMPTSLPNCQGIPENKPKEIVFACGDGGGYAEKLKWTGWGTYSAHASGQLLVNDCTPDCARGHFHSHPVGVVAYGKQRCPNGEIAYKTIKFDVPPPSWGVSHMDFPCKRM